MNIRAEKINLKQRFIDSSKWVGLGFISSQLLRFINNLILTRLLAPEVFGVMAVAMLIITGLSMFSDMGLRQNIIHSKRGEEAGFLNTAWVVQIVRGFIISLLLLCAIFLLTQLNHYKIIPTGLVYADPIVPSILATLAVIPVIEGFLSTKVYVLNRQLNIGRITLLNVFSQFFGLVVMIAIAFYERSIWAIVIGTILTSIMNTFFSHILLTGHLNRFGWDVEAFFEIFHFGKWIFISSLLGFLSRQGDRIILSGLIATELLGVYSIAFFISSSVLMLVTKLGGMTILPALSELARTDNGELSNKYYHIRLYIDSFVLIVAGLLMVSGPEIIEFLYDRRYQEAGEMISVLSFMLLGVGFIQADKCLVAIGQVKRRTFVIAVRMFSVYIFMLVGYAINGFYGALWGYVISIVPQVIYYLILLKKYNLLNFYKEIRTLPVIMIGVLLGRMLNVAL